MTNGRDVLWWLRLLLLAVVAVVSMVFGIEPGLDLQDATIGDLIRVIAETTDEGIADRGGVQALAELVSGGSEDELDDEPVGEIEDEPLTELPPIDEPPAGVATNPPGGVIGGSVTEGPSATETSASVPTVPPAAPAATAPPTSTPIPVDTATATTTPTPSPTSVPTEAPIPTATATAMPDPALLRLDDPVLRWLPELRAASAASGLSVAMLAALVQIESNGDPNPIGLDGGRGLTGIPGDVLAAQGWAVETWHDPAVNTLAGASWLASLVQATGTPDAALREVWGPDCDVLGQCAGLYAYAVLAWEQFYAPIVSNPEVSGIPVLPTDWLPPAIAPVQETGPRSIVLPSGVAVPTATVVPTELPIATDTPVPTTTSTDVEPVATPEA